VDESGMSGGKRRAGPLESSLAGVVVAFEGVPVVVELRNESLVKGVLDSADAQMNLHMSKVTYTKFQGAKQHLDAMYVRGTNIRMIHFPPKVDCAQRMKDQKRRRLEAKAASMKGALGPMNAPKPSGNPGDGAASGSGS